MQQFKIGDTVVVVDTGRTYTSFHAQADHMGLSDYLTRGARQGDVGTVVAVAKHIDDDTRTLCAVQVTGGQFLINQVGLAAVPNTTRKLKDNWSIPCTNEAQYDKARALLILLGYTFKDSYDSSYSSLCTSRHIAGGVTLGNVHRDHHFEDIMDFMIFHLDAQIELKLAIAEKKAELAALELKLAA